MGGAERENVVFGAVRWKGGLLSGMDGAPDGTLVAGGFLCVFVCICVSVLCFCIFL